MPQRRVYEYCYLHEVAKRNLETAEKKEEGQFYPLITCLAFCAFLLESVMNEIGDALINEWVDDHERKKPKDKRELIHEKLELVVDNGARPFQTFHEVFMARDCLVHAKPQRLVGDGSMSDESLPSKHGLPETLIEEIATVDNMRRIFKDTVAMITTWVDVLPPDRHVGLQCPSGPFNVFAHG